MVFSNSEEDVLELIEGDCRGGGDGLEDNAIKISSCGFRKWFGIIKARLLGHQDGLSVSFHVMQLRGPFSAI